MQSNVIENVLEIIQLSQPLSVEKFILLDIDSCFYRFSMDLDDSVEDMVNSCDLLLTTTSLNADS